MLINKVWLLQSGLISINLCQVRFMLCPFCVNKTHSVISFVLEVKELHSKERLSTWSEYCIYITITSVMKHHSQVVSILTSYSRVQTLVQITVILTLDFCGFSESLEANASRIPLN
jgi:hypothetical protein